MSRRRIAVRRRFQGQRCIHSVVHGEYPYLFRSGCPVAAACHLTRGYVDRLQLLQADQRPTITDCAQHHPSVARVSMRVSHSSKQNDIICRSMGYTGADDSTSEATCELGIVTTGEAG